VSEIFMSEKKEIQVIPFNAINEFMRDDYRLAVLQEVYLHLENGTPAQRSTISKLFASGVNIPGFRNSSMAPLPIKVKNSVSVFEKSAGFVGAVLEIWSNLHPILKQVVMGILTEKGWELQPSEFDRSSLRGFKIDWPKEDTFEVIHKAVSDGQPDLQESDDNISLMAVWIGNCLPYNLFAGEEEAQENS